MKINNIANAKQLLGRPLNLKTFVVFKGLLVFILLSALCLNLILLIFIYILFVLIQNNVILY